MPVTTSTEINHCSQHEFADIAYEVVNYAFQVHDSLGPMFHESIYRTALKKALGKRATEELEIQVEHGNFRKRLYVDLLVDSCCPFELKSLSSLAKHHESQLIQYLMLLGISHGKLINFGADRVEHRFVNCQTSRRDRSNVQIELVNWVDDRSTSKFVEVVIGFANDIGTGLSRSLYQEAIGTLLGGIEVCRQSIEAKWNGQSIGLQQVSLLDHQVGFDVTCLNSRLSTQESNLHRFLRNTSLKSLLWVNISLGGIRFQRFTNDA